MLNGDIVISIKELIEIYKDEIVCPKKSSSDFIGFLSRSFDLSEITVAEIDPVTRGALSKRWLSENNTVWMLKNNKKSATFYKYHHDRFYNKSHIYVFYNKNDDCFFSNCELLHLNLIMQRGINKEDASEQTKELIAVVNAIYLYHEALSEQQKDETE